MKIKNLEVNSFRGIPENLEISFSDRFSNPVSTIIYGENGSGKSSIVDAIEFNLQGRVERTTALKSEFKPQPTSYRNGDLKGSTTAIKLEDDSNNIRSIKVEFDEERLNYNYSSVPSKFHPNYKLAPIVLRRNDIINYASTPTNSKQVMFLSFVYGTEDGQKPTINKEKEIVLKLNKERLRLKKYRREKLIEISSILKVDIDKIPYGNVGKFHDFIRYEIRKGLKSNQYKTLLQKGKVSGVNEYCLKKAIEAVKLTTEIVSIQKKIGIAKAPTEKNTKIKSQIKVFLEATSDILTDAFKNISTTKFVDEIKLSVGRLTEMSCEIEIKLNNGKITHPNRVFSEANLDLLILLLFTSIIKQSSEFGQSKVLILDDVLQSVDATIRLNFIEYLLKNFNDWQLIITVHDRLWLNQLRHSFRRNQKKFKDIEIKRWDFDSGPQIIDIDARSENALIQALETNNTQIIASQAGIYLEFLCHKLSMNLNTSIQRRPDDKYTIGDLWPGIMKFFKKTELANLTDSINKLIHIRNLLGAHYNEWAQSLSDFEVQEFASLLLKFYDKIFCQSCHTFISNNKSCQCNKLEIA